MEVDTSESLAAGAAGNLNFNAAMLGAIPDPAAAAIPEHADAAVQGDADQHRLGANAPPPAANPTESADTELELTLEQVIEDLVTPYFIPAKWEFLGQDRRRRIEMTPAEFGATMLEYFKPEFLVTCGLFERLGEDVQLVGSLNRDAALLVEIDKSADKIEFTSDDEPLLRLGHTAIQCGLQRKPHAFAEPAQNLWVVASDEEVEILKRLKLPAVLSESLETLRKQEIEGLFAGTHRTDADWQYDLILVDFDIENLVNRPAAAIGHITKRLGTAASVYAIDPSRRFTVLRPTTNEFELLEQVAAFEDCDRVRQLLENWAEAAKRARFDSGITHDRREVPSFTAASQTLERVLQSNTLLPSSVAEAMKLIARRGGIRLFKNFISKSNWPATLLRK